MNHEKYGELMFFSLLHRYLTLNRSPTAIANKYLTGNKYSYFNHLLPITNKLRLLYKLMLI